jgi:hypothetical protein
MKTYSRIVALILLIGLSSTIWIWSQSTGQTQKTGLSRIQTSEESEFEKDLKFIEGLVAARNLQGLLQLSDELQRKWASDIKAGSRLQLEIINSLASYDFQDKKQYAHLVKLTKDVLKNADSIPIQLEYELVSKLQGNSAYLWKVSDQKDFELDRAERIKLLSHLWNRFQKDIDRNFDLEDVKNRPVGNVAVPAPNYRPGIRPEDVKELDIRAKYIAAIETNKAKAEKYNSQLELQRLDKKLPGMIDRVLTELYSHPPLNTEELERHFSNFKIQGERKDKIQKAVMNSRAQKEK